MGSGSVEEFLHCLVKGMLRRNALVEVCLRAQPKAANERGKKQTGI